MLDNGDLQAIRDIVKSEVREEIRQNNQYLIQAIGTMLEDKVVPQFNEIHRELF